MTNKQNTINNNKSDFIKKISDHTKIKYNGLTGLPNITECSVNCTINYINDNAIIKNEKNEYIIDYQHVGIFDIVSKTWYWSCGFYPLNSKKTKISKEIRKKILNIVRKKSSSELVSILTQNDIELMYFFLKNGICLDEENLEILVKLCLYVSQAEWILPYKNESYINFIAITKIISSK